MSALAQTLHIATLGYHVESDRTRGNPLAIASTYHVLFVPDPPTPVPLEVASLLDFDSPGVFRRDEIDRSLR